ncbi:homocysteine S-methyltransferase family protein [Butyrivibrio sp. AE2032]|uniref:homocysteine S-methyltransferase family protein n=1 Tax=Butyrivibrio sp. AE2032 TaxID=1458463 RepID=UPI000551A28D|nr:homocysteine S-methyltransferase family protein [Butyrivibrio sp. AE2032]
MSLRDRLGSEWLFCDGGTGSILQKLGLKGGELPETWNLSRPDDIRALNRSYFEAGSNIVNTNTFGANGFKFGNVSEIVTAAVKLCQEARKEAGREDDAYVAIDVGPTGKLLEPMGDLPFNEAVRVFAEIIKAGYEAGGDLVLIETMSDSYEAKAAVVAAHEVCDLPVIVTMVYDESGKLLTGGSVEGTVAMLEGLKVDAIGINCGFGPKQMLPIAERLVKCCSLPIVVNPNAGLPRTENGETVYDVDPEEFSCVMEEIAKLGVHVMGGCCGTTPDHIRTMINKVKVLPFTPPTVKNDTYVTSFADCVKIGKKPVIIGERINPTGKKKLQQALRENNIDYILTEALKQEEAGAHILDVNVGLPEIDEPSMMESVIVKLQSVTNLPLQIDTTNIEALERGMRIYNGKPMINSVNGKEENIEAVMPLVAKYGGVLVSLPLDEDGIPETSDGRIAIAKKIYEAADRYGIPRKDIVIDGLAMTVSSDPNSAIATLDTVRRVRDEFSGHSILGVSNISFGLPARELVNSHFLTMAMQNGLSCAIINPCNGHMMASYRSYNALMNLDPNLSEFIDAYKDYVAGTSASSSGTKSSSAASSGAALTLGEAIERGVVGRATEAMREALASGKESLEIIDAELIPALDRVGKGFEAGTVFLPQLLMSADAAKAAFAVVKEAMADKPRTTKGQVILATVKGDIHDIGKNIVKVMLENYGYDVIDLGKDVPPEVIVDCAIENNIKVVGLSALMTTTVASMEETIKQLRERKPDTKVVVGGAVMTPEYSEQIGADAYAKDAMATVRYCDSVFEA